MASSTAASTITSAISSSSSSSSASATTPVSATSARPGFERLGLFALQAGIDHLLEQLGGHRALDHGLGQDLDGLDHLFGDLLGDLFFQLGLDLGLDLGLGDRFGHLLDLVVGQLLVRTHGLVVRGGFVRFVRGGGVGHRLA